MKIDNKNRVTLPVSLADYYYNSRVIIGYNPKSDEVLIIPNSEAVAISKGIQEDYPGFENYKKRTEVARSVASLFVNKTIQSTGRVVIPEKFLERASISKGDYVDYEITDNGIIKLKKKD